VLQWNEEALQCIRATRPGPTIVARSLFVLHNAIYDAWAAYDEKAKGTRLGFGLRRPQAEWTAANKRQAVSHAAIVALSDVLPSCQATSPSNWPAWATAPPTAPPRPWSARRPGGR
jgi:hypothetical protein